MTTQVFRTDFPISSQPLTKKRLKRDHAFEEDVSSSISDEFDDSVALQTKGHLNLLMKPVSRILQMTQTESGGDYEDIEDSN